MRELLNEVQEELREEKFKVALSKYSPFIALFLLVLMAVVSGRIWYDDHITTQSYADGADYVVAVMKARSSNVDDAMHKFEELHSSNTAYGAASFLHSAFNAYMKKDNDKANQLLEELYNNTHYHNLFRNLAKLYEVEVMLLDTPTNYSKALSALKVYVESSNPMFKHIAQEKLLVLYFIMGHKEEARKLIAKMKQDPLVPEAIMRRIHDHAATISTMGK